MAIVSRPRHRRVASRPLTDEQAALLAMCNCRSLPNRPHTRLYCETARTGGAS